MASVTAQAAGSNEAAQDAGTGRSLSNSNTQLEKLIAGVADYAIYMLDVNGNIVTWNTGAERIKGYRAEEIIGRHFSQFYTAEDRAAGVPIRALATASSTGKYEAESWRVRKDGTRFWASVLIDAIHDDEQRLVGFAKVTRDMTERRAMEEQLRQSQKMEAIGQLTGGVAHDFNNLLTVIIGNLETISRLAMPQSQRVRHAIDQAMLGAQRAATLTQQLLAFARRQPLTPTVVDVNQLVSGMSELLQRTLGETVAVKNVLADDLWQVEADAHQLESALLNLAVNARDAMPSGGTLTIHTFNVERGYLGKEKYVDMKPGDYVLICVHDTGIGMDQDTLTHAFEPFFTTKPIGQGTGLGLSQVYGFAKQSNGHVQLESELGKGTTAKIYLPRMQGEKKSTAEDSNRIAAPPTGSETILVVEDDDNVRVFTTESLRDHGYEVLEASDAVAALKLLQQHPDIDLLFTDVGLAQMNGRQLADQALSFRPDLKVLFTSGYSRDVMVHQGRLDPGIELLNKPFTSSQLAARIRTVLDR